MKLLAPVLISTAWAANIFQSSEEAKTFLSRSKRANEFSEEWTKRSNLNRECAEEVCNTREFLEAAENFFDSTQAARDKFNDFKTFKSEYLACRSAVLDSEFRRIAGLNSKGVRYIDDLNFTALCLKQYLKSHESGLDKQIP